MYLHLLLHSSSLLHVFFRVFLLIRFQQLLCLPFEEVDFVLEFFLLIFKFIYFVVQGHTGGFYLQLLHVSRILFRLRWRLILRLFSLVGASSKKLVKIRHKQILYYLAYTAHENIFILY